MGNLVLGIVVVLLGLVATWQPHRISSATHSWNTRMSPRLAPYFQLSPIFVRVIGILFVLAGVLTVTFELLTHR